MNLDDSSSVGSDTGPQVSLRGTRTKQGPQCVSDSPTAHSSKKERESTHTFLRHRSSNSTPLHLSLGVNDNSSVVLKVKEDTVPPPPRLSLTNHDRGVHLLSEVGLSLLHGRHDHVSGRGRGESIESGSESADGDDLRTGGRVSKSGGVRGFVWLVGWWVGRERLGRREGMSAKRKSRERGNTSVRPRSPVRMVSRVPSPSQPTRVSDPTSPNTSYCSPSSRSIFFHSPRPRSSVPSPILKICPPKKSTIVSPLPSILMLLAPHQLPSAGILEQ